MCRWIAYRGTPVYMEELVTRPRHSLVHQSLHATEAKTGTNGDGFGLGWFGDRPEPGLYRELRPAWSDENLLSICSQVRSSLFFAHVRAATGTATSRANCHPFTHGGALFMHNGQVGCYGALRRRIENLIPDEFYAGRGGTTDSEAIFLIALSRGGLADPVGALLATLGDISAMMDETGACEPLRFTAAFAVGQDLYAFRWASDDKAPTLYYRETGPDLTVVSEPIDDAAGCWKPVPQRHVLVARAGESAVLSPFDVRMKLAA
jgi:predicted glutamine amidotransferase